MTVPSRFLGPKPTLIQLYSQEPSKANPTGLPVASAVDLKKMKQLEENKARQKIKKAAKAGFEIYDEEAMSDDWESETSSVTMSSATTARTSGTVGQENRETFTLPIRPRQPQGGVAQGGVGQAGVGQAGVEQGGVGQRGQAQEDGNHIVNG